MPEFIKNFFRRRILAKHCSTIPTGLMPLPPYATINVIIDVEEAGYEALKEWIIAWGRRNELKVSIYFFDFRKLDKNELLLTSVTTTIIRNDLNWYGMPSKDKITALINEESDLMISMVNNGDFPIEYLSKCAKAHFKIGRYAFPGDAFDMVISDNPESPKATSTQEIFEKIVEFIGKISK